MTETSETSITHHNPLKYTKITYNHLKMGSAKTPSMGSTPNFSCSSRKSPSPRPSHTGASPPGSSAVSSTGSMRSPTSKGNMTKTVHKMEMWRNIIHIYIYMYIYSVCNMIGICIYSTKNHLVIPTFPCFSHLSQQGHALIHRHQTGRFRCRGRRCLSPLQPALGVEGHRSQSSRGGQRRQASDAKNVAPWEHLGRKWRKFTVFFGCVSGFSLVFSGLFSKLRKAISWSFLILSPLGTGRNDKNIVGKWWMYVGQEPCKKKTSLWQSDEFLWGIFWRC